MFKSLKQQASVYKDYSAYRFNKKEWVLSILEGMAAVSIFSYFFYRSVFMVLILLPLLVPYIKRKQNTLCERRKYELNLQFKEVMNSVHASLLAGYSLENAFFESYRDISVLYGEDSMMVQELLLIKRGIRNNKTLEELLRDFAERSDLEDIRNFAQVLTIGKRSGGNLNEIIRTSVTVMEEKVSVMQEIQTMISAKKMELKIMNVIPFFIIFYVELTSPHFFDLLYHSVGGVCVMSICLFVYLGAVFLADKTVQITV